MPDVKFMRLAIEKAKDGIRQGQTPFAACIIKDSEVVACAHNAVWKRIDATAHAEINPIRLACKKLNSIDLSDCIMYSTTEPCPMCFSACHWARISQIVYGTSIGDSKEYGFNELCISHSRTKSMGQIGLEVIGGFLRDDCLQLFEAWSMRKDKKPY